MGGPLHVIEDIPNSTNPPHDLYEKHSIEARDTTGNNITTKYLDTPLIEIE